MSEEWCDLCDLPLNTCVHGRPPTEPAPAKRAAPTRKPRTPKPAKEPVRSATRHVARRFTPPIAYRTHILGVLSDHGGACPAEELLAEVHERIAPILLEGDHERVPGGEVRWAFTARKERRAMTDEGLLAAPRTPGVWVNFLKINIH